MKKIMVLLAALAGMWTYSGAKEIVSLSGSEMELIEENGIQGLESKNAGLQRSCILSLGKIQSERAVLPLMSILRSHPDEKNRIAAAWALCKIGDARGVYAVKMAVKFDENSKVRATCAWYYETLVQHGTFTFTSPAEPQ